MSYYSLIDNIRDLTNLRSEYVFHIEDYTVRYRAWSISEESLKTMLGQTVDLDDITVTETNSSKYGNECLTALEAISEDTCFLCDVESDYLQQINIRNKNKEKLHSIAQFNVRNKKGRIIAINVNDVCLTDNGDVYATDYKIKSITRLASTDSVCTKFSTHPLHL